MLSLATTKAESEYSYTQASVVFGNSLESSKGKQKIQVEEFI